MERDTEKVYVAVGSDVQDGFATLEWTLRRFSSHSISIVILHADINKRYVYTYYGKLPASYVNDQKLELLRKCEQGKMNKILHQYIAFCGKVKAETLNIEKYDEPIHKRTVELVSSHRITKLVMGITFMKSSSWKYRNPLSGLWHIQRYKPDFCELFLINGGKLFFLKEENNEGFIEDGQGVEVVKVHKRSSLKGWLGKMFPENGSSAKSPLCPSPSSLTSNDSPNPWEKCAEEIEGYFSHLLSSNVVDEVANGFSDNSSTAPDMPKDMNPAEKTELLKIKIGKAREAIRLKRIEAKETIERHAKAEWAITLCTCRAEELEAHINEEITRRVNLEKNLDSVREELNEMQSEVEQKKSKLDSTLNLQLELSNKLKSTSLAKSHVEGQLEKMVHKRAGMIQEIEKLRKQRDVMQRRIEFCKEKDAIGIATRLNDLCFGYKEFSAEEIIVGTDDFSERRRLKSSGVLTNVYRGHINHTTVAIKLYDSVMNKPSQEAFLAKVKVISRIHHPNLVAMLGFCSELKCIVFEYMHEGCLKDSLFSQNTRRNRALNWHARIRILADVCSGMGFLHLAKPRPIIHGNLNPSNILLDRNNVAKIHGFRLDFCYDYNIRSDIQDFGNLVLQLLTGRKMPIIPNDPHQPLDIIPSDPHQCLRSEGWRMGIRLGNGEWLIDQETLISNLDQRAGQWPLDLAMELARIAIRCLSTHDGIGTYFEMATVTREIEEVRKKADDLVTEGECSVSTDGGVDVEDSSPVPTIFFCPIYQDIMKNPHIAADGFSYELEAIEEWLGMGHDTSPMTNLQLKHTQLTPNHTLRSLIHDWQNKRFVPLTKTY